MMIPVTSIVGRLGIGWVSDFIGHRVILLVAVVAQAVGVALFLYARLPVFLVSFVVLYGVSYGGVIVLRAAILKKHYGSAYIGSLIGLCVGLIVIGSIGGPLLAGWIFDAVGNYDLAWVISEIIILIGIPSMLLMKKMRLVERGCS